MPQEYHTEAFVSALKRKGFREVASKHHRRFLFVYAVKPVSSIRTRISFGERRIGHSLLNLIARQLYLSRQELGELIECPLGYDEYVSLLVRRGHLRP